MARRKIGAGLTSLTLPVSVKDTSSTTGGGLSGLTSATAGLVCEYRRQGQSAWTAVTLSAGTLGTWSSGGFVADGSQAGDYELGLPDAAGASGARWVIVRLRGATNMLPVRVEIELDAVNYQDGVRAGLTALPNAAAGASGGLPLGDAAGRVDVGKLLGTASAGAAGTVALDTAQALPAAPTAGTTGAGLFYGAQQIGRTGTAQAGGANTITLDSGASAVDNIYASHEIKITSGAGAGQFATIAAYNGTTKVATITRPGTGNWTTNPDATSAFLILPVPYVTVQASLDKAGYAVSTVSDKTGYSLSASQTFNLTGNVTGSLSGSVGSVTGAVGSVSGAVTAGTVTDKTGYALTTAEHTAISGADVPAALTAQGYTTTRAGYLDTLNGLVATIWASVSRTLTTAADSSGVTTLLSRLTAGRATGLDNLDTNVNSRMATFVYTAPANPTDYARNSIAPSWWVSPDNADVATALGNLVTLVARTDPNTALSTLQTAASAIKAKTDLLTFTGSNVNAAISGDATTTLYGAAGAIAYTYAVYDVGGSTPLPGAAVYVSADSGGTQRSQTKVTDSLGRVTFQLDAGTAFFWASHPDRTFSNPVTEVIGP